MSVQDKAKYISVSVQDRAKYISALIGFEVFAESLWDFKVDEWVRTDWVIGDGYKKSGH